MIARPDCEVDRARPFWWWLRPALELKLATSQAWDPPMRGSLASLVMAILSSSVSENME